MKKFLSLALGLAMLLTLCACGTIAGTSNGGETSQKNVTVTNDNTASSKNAAGDKNSERQEMSSKELAIHGQKCTVTVTTRTITDKTNTGSGFFIDNQGTIVTAYHVIDMPASISVEVSDGGSYAIEKVIAFDPVYDIAILKIDYESKDYLQFSDEEAVVGESVYAVGSTLGTLTGTFTTGTVSSVKRTVGMIECLQTDAAISSGNSGGPLMNAYGEVVGINSFSYINGENLNLAIKVSMLENIGEDRNFTMNDMREWYEKESSRSYSPYDDDDNFYYSLVNTYDTVTRNLCISSVMDEDGDDVLDGYHDCAYYYMYDYDIEGYDQYVEYIKSLGFVYQYAETEDELQVTCYLNEKDNLEIFFVIQQSTNEMLICISEEGTVII